MEEEKTPSKATPQKTGVLSLALLQKLEKETAGLPSQIDKLELANSQAPSTNTFTTSTFHSISVKTTASTSKPQLSKRVINSSNWQKHLCELEDQKILVRLGTRLGVRFANCKVTLKLNSI